MNSPAATTKLFVSCTIALHREGLLAHTTLSSIEQARVFAEQQDLVVEWVITLDNHDALTEQIVRNHPALRASDTIEIVQYGDLSTSRNYAIQVANGDYIVCMDGDDYFSSNYIFASVQEASKNENSIIHPEYLFSFDQELYYTHIADQQNESVSSYSLFFSHDFSSSLTARREIFLLHPFMRCPPGFGYEDWHWNCEMRAKGFSHKPAPGTVLFYRRKKFSQCKSYYETGSIILPSSFFDSLPKPEGKTLPQGRQFYPAPLPWKALAKGCTIALLRTLPATWSKNIYTALLQWQNLHKRWKTAKLEPTVRNALLEAARIDGKLHPDCLPFIPCIAPIRNETPGRVYAAAWHSLPSHDYDIVFTAPHVHTGGADLMTKNYIQAICTTGKRVLCICTNGRPNNEQNFPQEAHWLNLGALSAVLPQDQQIMILTRLLVQLAPKIIHMVNDYLGWECILRHGTALKNKSRLIVSIFNDTQDENDLFYGAGTSYLRELHPHIARVITDNAVTAEDWIKRFGLPKNLFQPIYGLVPAVAKQSVTPAERNRVLWAGRLDTQKRPDILLDIAKLMPDIHFEIYGEPVLDRTAPILRKFNSLPNVTLHGRYDNFSALPVEKFFALCYTTQCDGLPNVLLEAVAAGLPVLAPNRGGIRDFITNDTGWLLPSHTDAHTYADTLREIQHNSAEAQKRWKRASDMLLGRHNQDAFYQGLMAAYL